LIKEFDWIDEEMFQRIENVNDKNALYEMALSSVNLGRVVYRVSRFEMFNCKSESDFAAKLHVVRLGFDRYMQDSTRKQWLIDQGRTLIEKFWFKAEKVDKNFTFLKFFILFVVFTLKVYLFENLNFKGSLWNC